MATLDAKRLRADAVLPAFHHDAQGRPVLQKGRIMPPKPRPKPAPLAETLLAAHDTAQRLLEHERQVIDVAHAKGRISLALLGCNQRQETHVLEHLDALELELARGGDRIKSVRLRFAAVGTPVRLSEGRGESVHMATLELAEYLKSVTRTWLHIAYQKTGKSPEEAESSPWSKSPDAWPAVRNALKHVKGADWKGAKIELLSEYARALMGMAHGNSGEKPTPVAEPPGGAEPAPKCRRMRLGEAEHAVRDYLAKHGRSIAKCSQRKIGSAVGCSTGLIAKTLAWKAYQKKLDEKGVSKRGTKTRIITDGEIRTVGSQDRELMRLIGDQQAEEAKQNVRSQAAPERSRRS